MAILTQSDGTRVTEHTAIQSLLNTINVHLERWAIPDAPELLDLLARDNLDAPLQDRLLPFFDDRFETLRSTLGYQARDLIVLYPGLPGLESLLNRFLSCHTHDDDEIRYIVDGEGIFGFVLPDESQIELTVLAGDYINVPKGAEHWFRLTPKNRIKAVRYFTSRDGWVPNYTGRPIDHRFGYAAS